MKLLEPYNKAIVALVGTLLTVVAPHFNASQGLQYLTGILTVLGVFHIRNGVVQDIVDDAENVLGNVVTPPVLVSPQQTSPSDTSTSA